MAGQCRVDGDLCGFAVADFTDHNDIRILADERAHRRGEGQPDRRLDLRLVDARNLVFDGILDGKDLSRRLVQDRQHGRERRGLSASGRARDQDQPMRQRQQTAQRRFVAAEQSDLAQIEQAAIARQQADYDALAVLRWHGGDADIDLNPSDPRPCGAVLRQPAFRDVKSGQDLDTGDDGLRRRIAWKRHGAEDPVNPHSHDKRGPEWLDVDVARSQFHGALKQIVDGPDHWSPARQIAQAVDVVVAGAMFRLINVHHSYRAFIESQFQNRGDVVEGCNGDCDGTYTDDLRCSDRGAVGRVRHRQAEAFAPQAKREHRRFSQKSRREMLNRSDNIHQFLKAEARQPPEARRLISKFSGRQIRFLPYFSEPVSGCRFAGIDTPQFRPRGVRNPLEQMQAKLLYRALWRRSRRALHRRCPCTAWHRLRHVPASLRDFTYLQV